MKAGYFNCVYSLLILPVLFAPLRVASQPEVGGSWFKPPIHIVGSVAGEEKKEGPSAVKLNTVKSAPYGNNLGLLISSALLSNPVVQSKSKLADAARYGVDVAKWQFYPTPSISVQQAHTAKDDPNYQGANRVIQLSLQQPVWTGGRLSAGLTLAEKQLAVAFADLEDSKEQIVLRTIAAFGGWASANEKVIAYESNVNYHRELQGLIRRRVDAGLSPESDFIFSGGRLDQAMADLETAKAQRANALTSLTQLLGAPINDSDLSPISRPLLRYAINRDSMLADALERRPSILKSQAQIEIQDSQIAIAKSSISPSLSLSLQRQNGDFSYSNVTTNTQNRAFLSISTSLGAGLSNFSQISGAISQKESAEAEAEVAKRNVTEQILSDIDLIKSSEYRVKSTLVACEAASKTEQSWQRQFLAGKKAWQDLLNATRELAICRANLADARGLLLSLNWRLAIYSMGIDQSLNLQTSKW
jgi:adhesin transport system outer membrane protein